MDIAAAGATIIFVVLLVAEILLGGLVLAYLGYSFFHVISETAAGNEKVIWPGELFTDWMLKGFHLFWLAALSILPACLIGNLASLDLLSYLVGCAACFWLLFPVVVLSFLSGASRFEVARWQIIQSMVQHPALMLGFYLSTALLFLVSGGIIWYSLEGPSALVVPVAALAVTSVLLIYARLLGRIAHVFVFEEIRPTSRKKRPSVRDEAAANDGWPHENEEPEDEQDTPAREAPGKHRMAENVARTPEPLSPPAPGAMASGGDPDELEDPLGPARGAYELKQDHAPKVEARQPWPAQLGPEPEPYRMIEIAPEPTPPTVPAPVPSRLAEYEKALAAPRRKPPPPALPLLHGIYLFPFYWTSLTAFAILWLGICGMGFIVRLMIQVFPA